MKSYQNNDYQVMHHEYGQKHLSICYPPKSSGGNVPVKYRFTRSSSNAPSLADPLEANPYNICHPKTEETSRRNTGSPDHQLMLRHWLTRLRQTHTPETHYRKNYRRNGGWKVPCQY
ncbi:hypothetical protein PIB30_008487 [Stylosanthes scabra]|uniref:Uncharacterized protein n=1 Tax=Stylosanthes scabra TaxID=79078 RepID=A0ABU6Y3N4_9FABA|nr:hypothetical protein [Stylosanthes scabra]